MAQTIPVSTEDRAPRRFEPTKSAYFIDGLMTYMITVGGIGVIIAVLGIFVFILSQILPLFQGAQVVPRHSVQLPPASYAILGADEWTEYPFLLTSQGQLSLVDLVGQRGVQPVDPGFAEALTFSAFTYDQNRQELVFATLDGRFSVVSLNYRADFGGQDTRRIVAEPKAGPILSIGKPNYPITQVVYGDAGETKLVAALQNVDGGREVHAVTLTQRRTLLGAGKTMLGDTFNLTSQIKGEPQDIAVNPQANGLVVATQTGEIYYFFRDNNDITLRQVFSPFNDTEDARIASMHYLLGGVSLILTNANGANRVFSLYVPKGGTTRLFGHTKTFPALPQAATYYASSIRNKAFLIGEGSTASLRYATTETVRWQRDLPFTVDLALLGGKYNRLLFLDSANTLHTYSLSDPHPEAGFKALFQPIWYEGANAPRYTWQSTGGTDDFEPKLSLIPIIIGTLKGTLYAMLFAVPIALLAAIYTSKFLHPNLRTVVKPTMEIMASLPSVILGFLAALWLAPLLETQVPSFLLMLIGMPLSSLVIGKLWSSLPLQYRHWIKPGYEFIAMIPVLIVIG
jgi:phosphate transport system permease protein